MTHILIVDDDPEICALLTQFLTAQGFEVTAVGDGQALRHRLDAGAVDLVILDLMLPGEDGLSLCRHLRTITGTPIIMLTAMGSETDRVVGLEMGADDYLAKPFSTRELLARIRAVLRRTGQSNSSPPTGPTDDSAQAGDVLDFSGWTLDVLRRRLSSPDGVLVEVTSGEFDLLLAFLRHPHQVLSRDQLLDLSRGRVSGPFDRTIDVQVGRLRRKMEADARNPELFKTVRGGGYVLATDVRGRHDPRPKK
ncbi:response regulator [Phaeospirillum tilakii]|uniref:Response regulator n=1 Tax=Phaeospirillum tilakii TaxID=741673 RepID=A0ABW5C6S8_9PROT